MAELAVQGFLREFTDPGVAMAAIQAEPYGITVSRHKDLALLNYGKLATPGDLADECRGLILRVPTFDVVSFSFRRFYNYGEGRAAKIHWPSAEVYEKLDGTLIVFYHDGDEWTFQTRGVADASGPCATGRDTFRERVMALLESKGFSTPDAMFTGQPRSLCWVCEYVGPYNRIVTPYATEDLYLLTVTDRSTLADVQVDCDWWPFSRPERHGLGSLDDILATFAALPKLAEGYVVRDGEGRRIKVKNPSYVSLHRAINAGNAPTDRNFAAIAIRGDADEIKSYFPEFAERIAHFEGAIDGMVREAEAAWGEHGSERDRKAFALAVKHLPLSAWLFARHSGKAGASCREWVAEHMNADKLAAFAGALT